MVKYNRWNWRKTGDDMFKNIRGVIYIQAEGSNIYQFINSIRKKHIICTSQKCRNGKFTAQIYNRDLKKIEAAAEESDINLTIVERKGLRFKASAYKFRFGIIIGILIVFGFIFYLSNTVVTIEVCGNNGITDQQVISSLADIGIYKGRFIPDIDFHSCEQRLRLSIPEISWTGIRHTGSRIVVDITEAVAVPETVNDDIPCNIIAAKDAQITYTEIYAGQLVRKIGDGVKKGDIIVSGTVDDGNGHFLKKHAMGKIKGIYNEEIIFTQPFEESGQIYSEDIETRKYFDFFGFRIPLFFRDIESKSYDYRENTTKFKFLGYEIPLGIIHCSYEPFSYDTITYSEEEADIKLQQMTSLHEKNFYDSKDITVIERKIEKKTTGKEMKYIISYTLEGDIGKDWEIYVD